MNTTIEIPVQMSASRGARSAAATRPAGNYFSCPAIRKAMVLTRYVKLCDEYVMDDSHKAPAARRMVTSKDWITRITHFKAELLSEMSAVDDHSLSGPNKNVIETLDQIANLEQQELQNLQRQKEAFETMGTPPEGVPQDYLCPISLRLMSDPVIAADGHGYERAAIEEWFQHKQTSPKTNQPLPSKALIPNHTLKAAILSFLAENQKSRTPTRSNPTRARSAVKPLKKGKGRPASRPEVAKVKKVKKVSLPMKTTPKKNY